ncbi:hypothetical protein ACNKU7_06130 [Microbulbifer sp. SA54]|uniref:hypothetical protein n=1 Tax=Microbulbifer sp. SA54 TaxID=3401577 RepID=UPI003AAB05FB
MSKGQSSAFWFTFDFFAQDVLEIVRMGIAHVDEKSNLLFNFAHLEFLIVQGLGRYMCQNFDLIPFVITPFIILLI